MSNWCFWAYQHWLYKHMSNKSNDGGSEIVEVTWSNSSYRDLFTAKIFVVGLDFKTRVQSPSQIPSVKVQRLRSRWGWRRSGADRAASPPSSQLNLAVCLVCADVTPGNVTLVKRNLSYRGSSPVRHVPGNAGKGSAQGLWWLLISMSLCWFPVGFSEAPVLCNDSGLSLWDVCVQADPRYTSSVDM